MVLLVNGEEKRTVEAVVDPSSDAMTVFNSIVTTDQLKELQEMNSETSIEFVMIATSTGTNLTI
jgi:catabolite regulation protein CreA